MNKKCFLLFFTLCFIPLFGMTQNIDHVILISIDGFRPDFYREEKWPTPNLKMLASHGVSADNVRTIFPSSTYPSHTTLITGVLPKRHGIYYNTVIEDDGRPGQWIYNFQEIQARTLWQAAKEKKLITASVSWPITVDNPYIDYNIPEFWSFENPMDRRSATANYARPEGLFQEVVKNATGDLTKDEYNLSSLRMDQNLGRIATYILEQYKPNLLTLHLPNLDGAEHSNGREGVQVARAVAGADQVIGQIFDAVQREGMAKNTVIIVTGDHGFVSTHTSIAPNLWLQDMDLADKAVFFSAGGSAFLHILKGDKAQILTKIKSGLSELPLAQKSMFRIVSSEEMEIMESDPKVQLAISAKPGFSFTNEKKGELLQKKIGGKHGHFPDFHQIYTGFIAAGPGIENETVIQHMALEDIAGMIAQLLDINLPETTGIVYPGLVKE